MRYIHFGDPISKVVILTHDEQSNGTSRHCLLLTVATDNLIAVKSGFASGYSGQGAQALNYALKALQRHGVEIEECKVTKDFLDRIDNCALTESDIEFIRSAEPDYSGAWCDYLDDDELFIRKRDVWEQFPFTIPLAIIDDRIVDLAVGFFDDPDGKLLIGYRRLEDIIRKRSGIDGHGVKLFSEVFLSREPKMFWSDISNAENQGRASLFSAVYMAFRNPRAHREIQWNEKEQLVEFLLLNSLFVLERSAQKL